MNQKLFALKDALEALSVKELITWSDKDLCNLMEVARVVIQKIEDAPKIVKVDLTNEEIDLCKNFKYNEACGARDSLPCGLDD